MDPETQRFVQSLGHVRWSWIFHSRSLLHIITGVVFTCQPSAKLVWSIPSEIAIFTDSENQNVEEILENFMIRIRNNKCLSKIS